MDGPPLPVGAALELGTVFVTAEVPAAKKDPFCCGLLPVLLTEGELAKLSLL